MDTREKIIAPAEAPAGCLVVTGTFDVVLAADARELAEIRAKHPELRLLVVVMPLADALLPQRARAELVAALRMVDYVVIGDEHTAPDTLQPAQVVRLEAVHAARKRQLTEHVQSRQTR